MKVKELLKDDWNQFLTVLKDIQDPSDCIKKILSIITSINMKIRKNKFNQEYEIILNTILEYYYSLCQILTRTAYPKSMWEVTKELKLNNLRGSLAMKIMNS